MICCIRIQKNVIWIIDDRRYKAQWHKGTTAEENQVLTLNLNLDLNLNLNLNLNFNAI